MFTYSPNIAINVKNPAEAVRFYTEVLGLELVNANPGEHSAAELKAGPITLWVDEASSDSNIGRTDFEFFVDDISEARKVVLQSNCRTLFAMEGPDFKGEMFADPYGLVFNLYQRR